MLFLVKFFFFFLDGVSFSRFIVDKCGPSEGLSLMNIHSSKNAFFKASTIGIHFTNILIFSVAFPFSSVINSPCFHKLLLDVPSRW